MRRRLVGGQLLPMQDGSTSEPIGLRAQRFWLLILLAGPAGQTACDITEHHENGMMFSFNVTS